MALPPESDCVHDADPQWTAVPTSASPLSDATGRHSSDGDGTDVSSEDLDEDLDGAEPVSKAEPPLVTLSRLKPVPVTAVWPTEPRHFTPWLLANADALSAALGLDIDLEAREYKVGKFSLDLIGRDLTLDRPLIVENQFGPTDHIHLGQIITYAGGTKPSTIVWIAEQFRDEHRAALDWLNTHTDTGVRFFGVKLQAVTIDTAPPGLVAPFFELVVAPNDYEKQAAAATASGGAPASPSALLYSQFWAGFAPLVKQRGWSNSAGTSSSWWEMSTGVSYVSWVVSYARFGCRSELVFQHPDPQVNMARWQNLAKQKDAIQTTFGDGELLFDDLPEKKACRIETRLLGPKIGEQEKWPQVRAWMIDTQERLRAAVKACGGVPASTVGSAEGA